MRNQLIGLRSDSSFEQARLCYANTVDQLALQGRGRQTASRVENRDRYWSPTRDVLDEAMRFGFVERQQLPSSRRYVDAHRHRLHQLTQLGHQVADEAENDLPSFYDRLVSAIYDTHPYFRQFIDRLRSGPIGCPEVAEGAVEQARRSGLGTGHWLDYACEQIPFQANANQARLRIQDSIVSVVRRRFGRNPERRPTSKQLAEALNDAYVQIAINGRGLSCGALDLKIMKAWGSQLKLLDQSRYVPAFSGQNVIWLAADVTTNGGTALRRKVLKTHEQPLVEAVIAAYNDQAGQSDSKLQAPYLPIFRVRAQAAFDRQVTRTLVDLVIERLVAGSITVPNFQFQLHLGTTRQPSSEPVYQRGGNRRYEITIQPQSIGD